MTSQQRASDNPIEMRRGLIERTEAAGPFHKPVKARDFRKPKRRNASVGKHP
jgi:hypothetical protein